MSWNLRLSALSMEDPARLLRYLSRSILASGGWVLSRSCGESEVQMNFEFERSSSIEMYTALIAAGLDLSQDSHHRLTELCQCTRSQTRPKPGETVAVDLEILARERASDLARSPERLEIV